MPEVKKPCGCPADLFPGLPDDTNFRTAVWPGLIEALTPVTFTIELKVRAVGGHTELKNILDYFRENRIAHPDRYEIDDTIDAINEVSETLEDFKDNFILAIKENIENSQWSVLDTEVDIDVYDR